MYRVQHSKALVGLQSTNVIFSEHVMKVPSTRI
jgi:hypothetical protein